MSKDFSKPLTDKNQRCVITVTQKVKRLFDDAADRIRKVEDRVIRPTQDEIVRRGCELILKDLEFKVEKGLI